MLKLCIKSVCRKKGITQRELADKINVSVVSLSRIATGQQSPSLDTIERMADVLNVEPWELFEGAPSSSQDFIAMIRRGGEQMTFTNEDSLRQWLDGKNEKE